MLQRVKHLAKRTGLPYFLLRTTYRGVREYYGVETTTSGVEQHYLRLREAYVRRLPNLFSSPGVEARAHALLREHMPAPRQPKRSLSDVRLFAVDKPTLGGPRILPMLARDLDTVVFNVGQHQEEFLASGGRAERIGFSSTRMASTVRNATLGSWRERLQRDLISTVEAAHAERPIDLLFAYGSPFEFMPETFQRIRSMGVPIALLWLDDKHVFAPEGPEVRDLPYPMGQKLMVGSCDVHLTNSRETLRWYLAEGVAAYYFPQGIDTELYAPRQVPRDIPVSFVGGAYGKRGDFVRSLLELGLPIHCYGRGWPNGVVEDEIDVYCRSRLNLGIGYVSVSDRITCIKGRDIEAPATGSLYLTTYDPELCELFDIGREIACYRNEFDCAELIRYYLERPELAEAIGAAGRARCLREHSWTARVEGLLRWMGILM